MMPMRRAVMALLLVLAGCASPAASATPSATYAPPDSVLKGFVEAINSGDAAAANFVAPNAHLFGDPVTAANIEAALANLPCTADVENIGVSGDTVTADFVITGTSPLAAEDCPAPIG